jgi:poly(3-hydroxybutyrate) depolymerase
MRIYAVGYSNGGLMAQALACSGRVHLAGVAVVASGLAAPAAAACARGGAADARVLGHRGSLRRFRTGRRSFQGARG